MNDFEIAKQGPQYRGASPLLGRMHARIDMRSDGREMAGSPLAYWMPDPMLQGAVQVQGSPAFQNEPINLGNMEAHLP